MYLDKLKHTHFNQNNDRGRHFELSYVFATSNVLFLIFLLSLLLLLVNSTLMRILRSMYELVCGAIFCRMLTTNLFPVHRYQDKIPFT